MNGLIAIHGDEFALSKSLKTHHGPRESKTRVRHHVSFEELKSACGRRRARLALNESKMPKKIQCHFDGELRRALFEMLATFSHQGGACVALGLSMPTVLNDRRSRPQALRHDQVHGRCRQCASHARVAVMVRIHPKRLYVLAGGMQVQYVIGCSHDGSHGPRQHRADDLGGPEV